MGIDLLFKKIFAGQHEAAHHVKDTDELQLSYGQHLLSLLEIQWQPPHMLVPSTSPLHPQQPLLLPVTLWGDHSAPCPDFLYSFSL